MLRCDCRGCSSGRWPIAAASHWAAWKMDVRLRGADYPLVTALVAAVGGREVFVPVDQVSSLDGDPLKLSSARLDLRHFERREGEVLLRADVLGHRLIDVQNARLVRPPTWSSPKMTASGSFPESIPAASASAVRAARPGGHQRQPGLPRLARLRVAHRARKHRTAARTVRPYPQAEAGPDRRPARGRLQGRGDRDPRSRSRGP